MYIEKLDLHNNLNQYEEASIIVHTYTFSRCQDPAILMIYFEAGVK